MKSNRVKFFWIFFRVRPDLASNMKKNEQKNQGSKIEPKSVQNEMMPSDSICTNKESRRLCLPARSTLNKHGWRWAPKSLSAQHSSCSFLCRCDGWSGEWKTCTLRPWASGRRPIELMVDPLSLSVVLSSQWNWTLELGTESTWQNIEGNCWSAAPTATICGCLWLQIGGSE